MLSLPVLPAVTEHTRLWLINQYKFILLVIVETGKPKSLV